MECTINCKNRQPRKVKHEAAVALAGVKVVTAADSQHGFNLILRLNSEKESYINAGNFDFLIYLNSTSISHFSSNGCSIQRTCGAYGSSISGKKLAFHNLAISFQNQLELLR